MRRTEKTRAPYEREPLQENKSCGGFVLFGGFVFCDSTMIGEFYTKETGDQL